jgi:hypothetical protein
MTKKIMTIKQKHYQNKKNQFHLKKKLLIRKINQLSKKKQSINQSIPPLA